MNQSYFLLGWGGGGGGGHPGEGNPGELGGGGVQCRGAVLCYPLHT